MEHFDDRQPVADQGLSSRCIGAQGADGVFECRRVRLVNHLGAIVLSQPAGKAAIARRIRKDRPAGKQLGTVRVGKMVSYST